MYPTSSLPYLSPMLSEQKLAQWTKAKDRISVLYQTLKGLDDQAKGSPFADMNDEAIAGWSASIARFNEIQASKAEIGRQQKEVAQAMVTEGKRNYELKIKDSFYAKALDQITQAYLKDQEDALTQAYEFIYQKQKRVTLDMVEERGKKTIQLSLHMVESGADFEETVDDVGFSEKNTLGTILLVHFIVSYKLPRIIFFDESFGGHEDGTLYRFMTLLQQFRDILGFKYLIVTHDKARMLPFADKVYVTKDGRYRSTTKDSLYNDSEGESPEGELDL